jgi:glycine cleavage system H protein
VSTIAPGRFRLGITDYGQEALGEVVFIDLPDAGTIVGAGDVIGEVESTKSVTEVYAPIGGTVAQINAEAIAAPGLVNSDPYGPGWLLELDSADSLSHLLDMAAYQELVGG